MANEQMQVPERKSNTAAWTAGLLGVLGLLYGGAEAANYVNLIPGNMLRDRFGYDVKDDPWVNFHEVTHDLDDVEFVIDPDEDTFLSARFDEAGQDVELTWVFDVTDDDVDDLIEMDGNEIRFDFGNDGSFEYVGVDEDGDGTIRGDEISKQE
ncbi:hypothetical protein GF362_01495 [Candidatus Dojkabacteria bacterium]|nr:hypothetical protein [Candidatus Dojkabacteria bacterium]